MAWDDGMTHSACPQCRDEARCHCHFCFMEVLRERDEAREAAGLLFWLPMPVDTEAWVKRYPWLKETTDEPTR